MAIQIIDGNLFDTKARYICHQVNCKGVMGSGVAKQIKMLYPYVYMNYRMTCASSGYNDLLGNVGIVKVTDSRVICNMFAQNGYGRDRQYTDYDAFSKCLETLTEAIPKGESIAMPHKIGCGLGGGDWDVIYGLIERFLGVDYNVELWRLSMEAERTQKEEKTYAR